MKVLILSLRYLGDCLLASSLAAPIKQRFPGSEVDLLTFKGNISILDGNATLDRVIGVDAHPSKRQHVSDVFGLWNHYDWAIITQSSTRALSYGYFASHRQSMFYIPENRRNWWKRRLVSNMVAEPDGHKLDTFSALLEPILGDRPELHPECPNASLSTELLEKLNSSPFVVFHLLAQYRDKDWDEGNWCELARRVIAQGFRVVLTGGPSQAERSMLEKFASNFDEDSVLSLAGRLSFGQTGTLIRMARAYVGVDTSATHVAAASGTPTIALFGPTSAKRWGPAPASGRVQFDNSLPLQRAANVTVIRNPEFLGCNRCLSGHETRCPLSRSKGRAECSQTIPLDLVWSELQFRLGLDSSSFA